MVQKENNLGSPINLSSEKDIDSSLLDVVRVPAFS